MIGVLMSNDLMRVVASTLKKMRQRALVSEYDPACARRHAENHTPSSPGQGRHVYVHQAEIVLSTSHLGHCFLTIHRGLDVAPD
jgi:hypothetical protein